MEEIEFYLEKAKEMMLKAVNHTIAEFGKIRAGKAMPNMLDGIMVSYYGNVTPIDQVATINTPDARTLAIKPWEKTLIQDIERAIINSNLGLNPQNDGEMIRINMPTLTEERRVQLVKHAKNEAENGRISVRNDRKHTMDQLKNLLKENASEDDVKRAEDKAQELTSQYIKKIDDLLETKEKEIMTV